VGILVFPFSSIYVAYESQFLQEFTRAVTAAIFCLMKVPNVPFQLMFGMATFGTNFASLGSLCFCSLSGISPMTTITNHAHFPAKEKRAPNKYGMKECYFIFQIEYLLYFFWFSMPRQFCAKAKSLCLSRSYWVLNSGFSGQPFITPYRKSP
jgi:hypothetical protein